GKHGFQLGLGWWLLADGDEFVFDSLFIQIFSGFAAGVAVFVGVKPEFHLELIEKKKATARAASSKLCR
ncbi:MAG: hypothetical protein ACI8QI_001152, partial [Limisphaerales bacterium]